MGKYMSEQPAIMRRVLLVHEFIRLDDQTKSFGCEQNRIIDELDVPDPSDRMIPIELDRLAVICAWCRDVREFAVDCPDLHLDSEARGILVESLMEGTYERCWLHTRSREFLADLSRTVFMNDLKTFGGNNLNDFCWRGMSVYRVRDDGITELNGWRNTLRNSIACGPRALLLLSERARAARLKADLGDLYADGEI
jgi:hypothetical protein